MVGRAPNLRWIKFVKLLGESPKRRGVFGLASYIAIRSRFHWRKPFCRKSGWLQNSGDFRRYLEVFGKFESRGNPVEFCESHRILAEERIIPLFHAILGSLARFLFGQCFMRFGKTLGGDIWCYPDRIFRGD